MTVDTDQKYQEKFEAAANMIYQMKQRDQLNKGHGDMPIPDVEEVLNVSSYPLLEYIGFDTDIYDGVAKMRAATILGEIVRLHQRIKNPLKYIQRNSKYGHLFAIPDYDTQEYFSRAARDKGWFDEIILHISCGKEENNLAMAQYLSKYFFEKYKCGLPVITYKNTESFSAMVYDANITLTILKIICNYKSGV